MHNCHENDEGQQTLRRRRNSAALCLRDHVRLLVADSSRSAAHNPRRMLEKRTTREYLPHAQQLYDWLLRPLLADLRRLKVNTLVFVPDGKIPS